MLIIFISSCDKGANKDLDGTQINNMNSNQSKLLKGDQIRFELDAITTSQTTYYQYFENNEGDAYLATLSSADDIVYVNHFGWDDRKIINKTEIEKEGENGIASVSNYAILKDDLILIYSYPFLLSTIDYGGNLLTQNNFLNLPFEGSFFPTKGSPILWNENQNIFSIHVAPNLVDNASPDIPVICLMKPNSEEMQYLLTRSNKDEIGHRTALSLMSYTYNPSQEIYVAIGQRGDKFHLQSIGDNERFIDVPSEIQLPSLKVYGQPEVSIEGLYKNDKFTQITYDKWRNVYYLIKAKALTDADYEERNPNQYESLPLELIVLNEEFKVLDQVEVKRGEYYVQMGGAGLFVSPKGLHLLKYETDSDDYMVFDTFEFVQ